MSYSLAANSEILYAIWVCLTIWCEGGHFTLIPNVLKIIYAKQAVSVYGVLFTYTGFCGLIMLGLLMTELAHKYIIFWIITAGCSGISLLLLLTMFMQDRFTIVK